MRPLLIASALLLGCGGAGERPKAPPLPEGRGVYQARLNPPTCLVERPELHVELRTPQGWERVALVEADESLDLVRRLTAELRIAPDTLVWIEGELTERTVTWSGNHAARILSLIALDPPPPPEATE